MSPAARALLVVVLLAGVLVAPAPSAAALPAGFVDEAVVDVPRPTAFASSPAGLLVTTQPGLLRLVRDDALVETPVLDLSARLCTNSERGLLGVAVPEAAETESFPVFLFFTENGPGNCDDDGATNAVSRFTFRDGRIDPGSEERLLQGIPSTGGNHNAGDLAFGADGMLYVTVGDGGTDHRGDSGSGGANDAARDRFALLGKVLRITPDGDVPPDNPFVGVDGAVSCAAGSGEPGEVCTETFAQGFRNPFRIAFDPDAAGTRFRVNDVGQNAYEEIDEGIAGADYGWNACEATHDNPDAPGTADCGASGAYEPPVHEYAHTGGCASITGGAFVPDGVWPAAYDDLYLYADFACGQVFALPEGGGPATVFADDVGPAVHLGFAPSDDGPALYYTTYAGDGQVRRIRSTEGGNQPPVADLVAEPASGPSPLEVTLDATGSADPDGDALTYAFDPGDGSAPVATDEATTTHTYTAEGPFTASVVVTDARGARSAPATADVAPGSLPPEAAITAPAEGARYAVGDEITLRGTGEDPEDGTLPGAALEWSVALHHDEHAHPLVPETAGDEVTFTAPPPEDLAAVGTSHLVATLTVTDGDGLTDTATRRLDARTAEVPLATDPAGLTLTVNGTDVVGPAAVPSWVGYDLEVTAPEQTVDGVAYRFERWSDGGAGATRTITTTAEEPERVAVFARVGAPPVERVGGAERIATAVAISRRTFPADCALEDGGAVVLARADAYPDALAGGPLATARGGPVLLTGREGLAPATAAELERLCAGTAVLLGGEAALPAAVADQAAALAAVERLGGGDRFATAALVAEELPSSPTVYLVEGIAEDPARGWPDAVSASWVAAGEGAPVLLSARDVLPPSTAAALSARQPARTVAVGGTAALSDDVVAAVEAAAGGAVERAAGADRYGTSRALADRAAVAGEPVVLATGLAYPDALSAGPLVVAEGATLLLVDGRDLEASAATADWLAEHAGEVPAVIVVGGEEAVGGTVAEQAAAVLGG